MCGKKSCIKPYLALFSLFLGRLPQLMSLESASAGAEDYKFETETFCFGGGVTKK